MLNLSFRQQVFAGFTVSVVLVFIVGLLSYQSIIQSKSDADLVNHTQRIVSLMQLWRGN
jgi:CHASE3 domain sensor protein